jgi:protein subunit release factor A
MSGNVWSMKEFLSGNEKSDGKTVKCYIVIEINGEKIGYKFTFNSEYEKVRRVKITKGRGRETSALVGYREILR